MLPQCVHVHGVARGAHSVTDWTSESPAVYMTRLNVILHIAISFGTERALETEPGTRFVFLHVLADHLV